MPKRNAEPNQRLEVQLPERLAIEASLFLRRDALTGRVAHGEWSRYVQRLIRADLAQRAQGANHAQL